MPTLDEVHTDVLFCMFKGEIGTRKSTAALSFPKPIYYFDIDQKMTSLSLPARAWSVDMKQVHYDSYNDYAKIRAKLEALQLNCPYKTIVLDSVTSMGDVTNRQTMKAKSGTTTKSGDEKGLRIGGIAVNSLEDYKAEAAAFQEMMALMKDISSYHKVNVILIAHVIGNREVKADSAAATHFARIIITGGKTISGKIPAYCPEVYHFNIEQELSADKEGHYALLTVHTGDDFARTALPLERKIIFDNKPLYETYLKPAIDQLNSNVNNIVK